jgi:hypothetical protein
MGGPCRRRRAGRADRGRCSGGGDRRDLRREQLGLRRLPRIEPEGARVHLGHGGPDDNRPERDIALQCRRLQLRHRFGVGDNNRHRGGGDIDQGNGWRVGGRRDSERCRRFGDSHRRHIRPGRCLGRRAVERRRAAHWWRFHRFQRRIVGGHVGRRRGRRRWGCRRRDHSSFRGPVGSGGHIARRWNRRPGTRHSGGPWRHSCRRDSRTGRRGLTPHPCRARLVTRGAASRAAPGGRP